MLAGNDAETSPYARDLSASVVTSATYAKTEVTRNTPLILIIAKNHQVLIVISGIGAQAKSRTTRRKNFLPHASESAPIKGHFFESIHEKHMIWKRYV